MLSRFDQMLAWSSVNNWCTLWTFIKYLLSQERLYLAANKSVKQDTCLFLYCINTPEVSGYWLCSMNSPGNQGLSCSDLSHVLKRSVSNPKPHVPKQSMHIPKSDKEEGLEIKVKCICQLSRWHSCSYSTWLELIHTATLNFWIDMYNSWKIGIHILKTTNKFHHYHSVSELMLTTVY